MGTVDISFDDSVARCASSLALVEQPSARGGDHAGDPVLHGQRALRDLQSEIFEVHVAGGPELHLREIKQFCIILMPFSQRLLSLSSLCRHSVRFFRGEYTRAVCPLSFLRVYCTSLHISVAPCSLYRPKLPTFNF